MYSTATQSSKKRSRESEIALLESISTSLDTYIGDKPLTASTTPSNEKKKASASDVSKNAAKNFLAAKTLVRSIARACASEKVKITETSKNDVEGNERPDALLDSLVEEYKEKYPSLTRAMLADGIVRHSAHDGNAEEEKGGEEKDDEDESNELKFGRIIAVVDAEMCNYHEKLEALKKSREQRALEPPEPVELKRGRKRKVKDETASGDDGEEAATPKKKKKSKVAKSAGTKGKKPWKPRGGDKNDPENILVDEITKRYLEFRGKRERLPNGAFEQIVEDVKRDLQMESCDVPVVKLDKKVRYKYNRMVAKEERTPTQHKLFVEEIYARYARTKEANGGKLKPGTIEAIIEGVKLEYGLTDNVNTNSLRTRVQSRFTKEHPEFESNPPDQLKIAKLSDEDRHKRQVLMNEVTNRYIREKEGHPKKLADGTLDRIIEQTKNDLNIHQFDVPKETIRGRIHRKSPHVQTLRDESPYNAVDVPLVETINSWLSQGISVTRAQGLDLANRLLKGKGMAEARDGKEIVLDAKWWRNFLERNKRKLVCASTTSGY